MPGAMTRSGKERRRFRSKTVFKIILVGFIFYLLLCVAGPFYLLFTYSSVDLPRIEPPRYTPKLAPLNAVEVVTAFNTYHPRFNSFGSRNRFEVTRADRNLVYLLGDSFLFGYGLEDQQTIAHHMNRLDPTRKYVNLAQPGTNIVDSVARYRVTRKRTSAPRAVIIQTLLENDIYAATEIEVKLLAEVAEDRRLLLFPVTLFVDQSWLFRYRYRKFTEQISRDLSRARFDQYVRRPLQELAQAARRDRAQVFVIEYTDAAAYPDYHRELARLCASLGLSLHKAEQLVSPEQRDLLPDLHPGPRMNRIIAEKLSVAVRQRLAVVGSRAPSSAPTAAP
jgi:hypothetical protein